MKYYINKNNPTPYYYQIQLSLEEGLKRGEWDPNDFLPSERELSEKFKVSRITIKKALNNLMAEGLIKIIKGKGAVVSEPRIEDKFFYNLVSSFKYLKDKGFKVKNEILDFKIISPDKNITEELQMSPADKVYYTERLRLINDEPYHFTKSYLPVYLYDNLTADYFINNSIYEIIDKKYNQSIRRIIKIFESITTSFEDAKIFKTSSNFPLLFFINKTFNKENIPIEFSFNKIRGDLSKFRIELDVNKNKNLDLTVSE
jgi:GntR family transcriptional regulator